MKPRFVISGRLRAAIRKSGLNKSEVQRLTGASSYPQIFKVLAGESFGPVMQSRLMLLAEMLGVPADDATTPYKAKAVRS
jgi:hypothetical protein